MNLCLKILVLLKNIVYVTKYFKKLHELCIKPLFPLKMGPKKQFFALAQAFRLSMFFCFLTSWHREKITSSFSNCGNQNDIKSGPKMIFHQFPVYKQTLEKYRKYVECFNLSIDYMTD